MIRKFTCANIGAMKFQDLVKHFGTQAAAAKRLGVSPPALVKWKKEGIPPLRQLHIQHVTRGRLKASHRALA